MHACGDRRDEMVRLHRRHPRRAWAPSRPVQSGSYGRAGVRNFRFISWRRSSGIFRLTNIESPLNSCIGSSCRFCSVSQSQTASQERWRPQCARCKFTARHLDLNLNCFFVSSVFPSEIPDSNSTLFVQEFSTAAMHPEA
ncbi:hypothetical protein SEVIR_7G285600v4 [Setaria viridis]|uniref:Uncharacterized protein n=1 Tax=Setaria viridis TaxID=4556 RepID=A0A4V6D4M3_SETVI|nr:hypothetical protein SEVIR_7G285600v2 [Setaria viridis]